MHARFYNPQLGRFLSVDPVTGAAGSPQSWNRCAYVQGRTLNFVDPTGRVLELTNQSQAERDVAVTAIQEYAGPEVAELL